MLIYKFMGVIGMMCLVVWADVSSIAAQKPPPSVATVVPTPVPIVLVKPDSNKADSSKPITATATAMPDVVPKQSLLNTEIKSVSGPFLVSEPQYMRMVIRNAALTLNVQSVLLATDSIGLLTTNLGGYVHGANVLQNMDGSAKAEMTLKVPSDKLEIALAQLRAEAMNVHDERVTAQDVTFEYADFGVQVKNLEANETQIREVLAKTVDTKDVALMLKQLPELREQIQHAKGRMRTLSQSTTLSTIALVYTTQSTHNPVKLFLTATLPQLSALTILGWGLWRVICWGRRRFGRHSAD